MTPITNDKPKAEDPIVTAMKAKIVQAVESAVNTAVQAALAQGDKNQRQAAGEQVNNQRGFFQGFKAPPADDDLPRVSSANGFLVPKAD